MYQRHIDHGCTGMSPVAPNTPQEVHGTVKEGSISIQAINTSKVDVMETRYQHKKKMDATCQREQQERQHELFIPEDGVESDNPVMSMNPCEPYSSKSPQRSSQRQSKSTCPTTRLDATPHDKRPNYDAEVTTTSRYHLLEIDDAEPQQSNGIRRSTTRQQTTPNAKQQDDYVDEQYEARVALVVQFVLCFFCVMMVLAICLAVFNAILSDHGYWVILVLCLILLVSSVLGLGCFLYQVMQEADAPTIQQKHFPKWYRTLRKIVRDELSDFREDWIAMCNNTYLLEDGMRGPCTGDNDEEESSGAINNKNSTNKHSKSMKRRGKSTLFKLVAKPASILASFRRKRRDKRRQGKGQTPDELPASIHSTFV